MDDVHGAEDATLAGYFRVHERPPGFEGPDGDPYTVSPEAEKTPDLRAPWEGFLVFPRWAATGLGVVGHVETPTLARGRSKDEVLKEMGALSLVEVQALLHRAVAQASGSPAGTDAGDRDAAPQRSTKAEGTENDAGAHTDDHEDGDAAGLPS